jgi:hypothetical protein
MYLLTTLIKTVGCPSDLGSQWRLRSGCSPYIEFVTNFVLPRATGSLKNVKPLPFATVADECRLISHALEVIEAIIVRYVVPFNTEQLTFDRFTNDYKSFLNMANADLGVSLILPEILRTADSLNADEIKDAIQDFKSMYINPQDRTAAAMNPSQTSANNLVPLAKTPGFCIMSNLLSFNKSPLFSTLQQLLYHNGGPNDFNKCHEIMAARSLSTALFRETPPSLDNSKRSSDLASQQQRRQLDEESYQSSISLLQQSMIQSVHPALLLSCSENGCQEGISSHGKSSSDVILWREQTVRLTLRILCAAAARENVFIQLLKDKSLSIIPTLSFKGPIHGSYGHRFLEEQKVCASKLSNLLTKAAMATHQPEVLPLIADYVGFNAKSLKDHQSIAKNALCIVSYITQTFPQAESIRFLCGDDVRGNRLANSFSRGLLLPAGEDIQHAIVDLTLSNIGIDSPFHNLSLMILGLNGSKQNCLNAILDLISDVSFVLSPRTASSATKCFELIFRLMQLDVTKVPSVLLSPHFWRDQTIRFLGTQSPATASILQDVTNSFGSDHGDDTDLSKRNDNVIHSISWFLKGLSLELYLLAGAGHGYSKLGNAVPAQSLTGLLRMLLSPRDSLLQRALVDLPLGRSNNEIFQQSLNSWKPTHDVLKSASIPMPGPSDVVARFQSIDVVLLSSLFKSEQQSTKDATINWASAWNSYAARVCACSHISQAWSDLCRTTIILSHTLDSGDTRETAFITRATAEMLSTVLLRLNTPGHLEQLGQYGVHDAEVFLSGGAVESESVLPLSVAALCLTDLLSRDLLRYEETIADEDVTRVCALLEGAVLSQSGPCNNESAGILKCAFSQMESLLFCEK